MEQKSGIIRQFAECFTDHRNSEKIEHTVDDLLAQGIFGLALGYEDLSDHDRLRYDPIHGDQLGKFFQGYYKWHYYLPLYVFCGEHLLCAKLRTASRDACDGTVEQLMRLVPRIRESFQGSKSFCEVMMALRHVGLKNTKMERAQCHTIREKLLKVGARIRATVRKVWLSFSESYLYCELLERVLLNIRKTCPLPLRV